MDMHFPPPSRDTAQPIELPGFATLVAVLAAAQANGRTARLAAGLVPGPELPATRAEALALLFAGASGWPLGAGMLAGSFHAPVAAALAAKGM